MKREREILVVTPPLAEIRERLTRPSELLLYMLTHDLCAPDSAASADLRAPFLVHGRTFIEVRELLGRSMFRAREDYGEWAAGMARTRAVRELDDLLAGMEASERDSGGSRAELQQAVGLQAADPRSGRPHEFLVEWLGDVTALQAAVALEADLANALLEAGADRHEAEQRADRVDAKWERLGRWFPPAFDLRVVALLLPVHDPERDVVGFYRFVLPRPRSDGVEPRTLPDRPLGLRSLRWLLDRPGGRDAVAGRMELLDVDYGPATRRGLRRAGCPTGIAAGPGATAVLLTLAAAAQAEGQGLLYLLAYYPGGEAAPACVRVEAGKGSPREVRELQQRLEEIVSMPE